jgi:isopenicillin N synthase-like dioxygenase
VLDCALLKNDVDGTDGWIHALRDACLRYGMFHISNVDALLESPASLSDAISAMKSFFALPVSEKRRLERSSERAAGFSDCELTKQRKDVKEVLDVAWVPFPELELDDESNRTIDGYNVFPDDDMREKVLRYYREAVDQICVRLLQALCVAFQIDFDAMRAGVFDDRKNIGFMRLNYYPSAGENMNIHEHTDAGLFTVLWTSEISGLEYEHRETGRYVRLTPVGGSDLEGGSDSLVMTVNVGDMWEVLTNGLVRAPKHRVILPPDFDFPRYSIALFANPNDSAIITPQPKCVDASPDRKRVYRDVPWGQFRSLRFQGDLNDRGKEIQISDYSLIG